MSAQSKEAKRDLLPLELETVKATEGMLGTEVGPSARAISLALIPCFKKRKKIRTPSENKPISKGDTENVFKCLDLYK